jgi:succinate dehydrogenase / fumarate reductase, cytochrome b subunit
VAGELSVFRVLVMSKGRPGLWSTTVGKKAVMAVTGAGMLVYVAAHMLADLKIFFGRESLDGYGIWLRQLFAPALGYGGFVWLARAALLACLALHVAAAAQLARRAGAARPVGYQRHTPVQGSYAARTMRWGGVIIGLFVVYHVLDITTGTANPHGVPGDDYQNIVSDFQPHRWYIAVVYAVAVLAVGAHIRHGLWSAFQSLGVAGATRRALRATPAAVAVVVCAGYLSIPVAVLTGLVR